MLETDSGKNRRRNVRETKYYELMEKIDCARWYLCSMCRKQILPGRFFVEVRTEDGRTAYLHRECALSTLRAVLLKREERGLKILTESGEASR